MNNLKKKKIPFDDEPILRREHKDESYNYANRSLSPSVRLFIAILVIINLVLGGFVFKVYKMGFQNITSNTINNSVYDTNSMSIATSKAVLSTVCVAVGSCRDTKGTHYGDEIDYFYNVESMGSGVVFKDEKTLGNAYIITNYHVVEPDIDNVYILLYGSQNPIKSIVVGFSSTQDIAVLKVSASNEYKISGAQVCSIANSASIYMGDKVVAVGNPLSGGLSATSGDISVVTQIISLENGSTARVMRTSASINNGNSGGGLFNDKGDLIGIVNAKISDVKVEGIAFAIPSNLAVSIANNIIRNGGTVKKAVIGITMKSVFSKAVYNNDTSRTSINYEIYISDISTSSAATSVGFQVSDKLLKFAFDDTEVIIDNLFSIEDYIYNLGVGDQITFTVLRGDVTKELTFTISSSDMIDII